MNILVTGATQGIGKAIVYKFAQHQYNVAFCARNASNLAQMQNDLQTQFPNIKVASQATNMANKQEVQTFAQFALQALGTFDVVVNNAGVFLPGSLFEESEGVLEQQIETNLYSAYHLTRAVLAPMIQRQQGHIFNICSTASTVAYPNGGSYCISKFALLGFSKVLREEMKPHNIKVTSIMPGATLTASWQGTNLPQNRFMKPQDVADVIWSAHQLSEQTVIEELVMRPVLGDIE